MITVQGCICADGTRLMGAFCSFGVLRAHGLNVPQGQAFRLNGDADEHSSERQIPGREAVHYMLGNMPIANGVIVDRAHGLNVPQGQAFRLNGDADEHSSERQIPGREAVHYMLGNMPIANGVIVDSVAHSEDLDEGEGEERENGYPLVADLSQLRLHSHVMRSVDEVIEQQAFNQEVIDDLNVEQRNAHAANSANEEGDGVADEEGSSAVAGGAPRNGNVPGDDEAAELMMASGTSEQGESSANGEDVLRDRSVAPSFVFSDDEAAELMMASGTSEQGESSANGEDVLRDSLPANTASDVGA
ncbi:hypothetical protein Tcan_05602 [Toxocara canis]|uniref:Uncharacterized protein n=1 Tax=Toxocara canis TaxID=6265 RepID=A0A0B2V2N3_TOXCA|nr:hypothetical protein Tcan_05602 [Toxocara canis]